MFVEKVMGGLKNNRLGAPVPFDTETYRFPSTDDYCNSENLVILPGGEQLTWERESERAAERERVLREAEVKQRLEEEERIRAKALFRRTRGGFTPSKFRVVEK
jgi:hypothetical protein